MYHLYVESKIWQNEPIYKSETDSQTNEQTWGCMGGEGVGEGWIGKLGFSSVWSLSHALLCDSMDCSTPGLPVHHQSPEFTQTHVYRVSDAIQPSHPIVPLISHLQFSPALRSFPMSQFFTSGGQSIGVSALASVLPMNI